MPRMKTRRSAAKRIKVSKKGKLLRKKAMHSHILTKKTRKRKRRLRKETTVSKSGLKKVRHFLLK